MRADIAVVGATTERLSIERDEIGMAKIFLMLKSAETCWIQVKTEQKIGGL